MKREKVMSRLAGKGIHTAKDISTAELSRKAAHAALDPALTAPPYRPLPPITKLSKTLRNLHG